jgi:hypothetical protein
LGQTGIVVGYEEIEMPGNDGRRYLWRSEAGRRRSRLIAITASKEEGHQQSLEALFFYA